MVRPRFLPDNLLLALLAAIVLATLWPVRAAAAETYGYATTCAVAVLFFLHGAKLSRAAAYAGATHTRLHLCVLASTFVLFPLLGLLGRPLLSPLLTPGLYAGLLFLCVVPSTVQSSIAFTSVARGNVSAAVCSASASNLLGVVVTPLLAGALIHLHGSAGISLAAVGQVFAQILLPFAAGQSARRWLGHWVVAHPKLVKFVDQGAIVMVVYGAFSASIVAGLWQATPLYSLALLLGVDTALLALVLGVNFAVGRTFFARDDEIVLVFCGSKKSLASGIPIAKVLFAGGALGASVLPLMIFHQIQLLACAVIARRYARHAPDQRAECAPAAAGHG